MADEEQQEDQSVLTRKRLADLIGGENALALIERYGGHQVPNLTPRAAELMRRDISIRRRLDRGEGAREIARELGIPHQRVSEAGKMPTAAQAGRHNRARELE